VSGGVEPNHVEANTDPKSIRVPMPLEYKEKLFPLGPGGKDVGVPLEFGYVSSAWRAGRRRPAAVQGRASSAVKSPSSSSAERSVRLHRAGGILGVGAGLARMATVAVFRIWVGQWWMEGEILTGEETIARDMFVLRVGDTT
jgi:hypothetical protein